MKIKKKNKRNNFPVWNNHTWNIQFTLCSFDWVKHFNADPDAHVICMFFNRIFRHLYFRTKENDGRHQLWNTTQPRIAIKLKFVWTIFFFIVVHSIKNDFICWFIFYYGTKLWVRCFWWIILSDKWQTHSMKIWKKK